MPDFDPYDHQYPAPALVQVLRGLPLGHVVKLPGGTLIKSVPMNHGPSQVRRYAVVRNNSPLPRMASRQNTVATAEKAAEAALRKGGSK